MPRRVASALAALVALALVLVLVTASACTTSGILQAGTGSPAAPHPSSNTSAGSSTATGSSPKAAPAAFADCSSSFNLGALGLSGAVLGRLRFDCAQVRVPLDYSDPSGKKITIAIVRVHDTSVKPIGSLLVNPGGPGASGIELALGLIPQVDNTLLKHFDLIGFDPRGVGSSTPISCLTDAEKDAANAASLDVRTSAGFTKAKQLAASTAKKCSSKYGSELPYFNTVNTARDMDQIRQAVGDAQMNYLGFSYGTELGAQYAHLFPGKIRVAVLDGAVNPLTDDITSFANQLQGFEQSFDQFSAYCVKTAPCSALRNPRQAVYTVAAKATKAPIPASGDSRKATSSLVYTGVLSALYSRSSWPTLGSALLEAEKGNSEGLLKLADQYNERYDGHYTNLSDANLTISCNDSPPGPSDPTIRSTTASWVKRFPMFGLWSAASLFACQQWQPKRTVPPLPTATTSAHKVLVIGNLHDPATPYAGAKALTKTLGNAELLSWNGEGHTSYLRGSSCVDDAVNTYLVNGTLPRAGTLCPA